MEQNNFKRKKNLTNLLSEESQAQILIELSIHRRVSEFHSKVAVQKFFVNIEVLFYVEAFLELPRLNGRCAMQNAMISKYSFLPRGFIKTPKGL